jgi:succinate dehydrogenase / fumarate reductase flavoprotein subunit
LIRHEFDAVIVGAPAALGLYAALEASQRTRRPPSSANSTPAGATRAPRRVGLAPPWATWKRTSPSGMPLIRSRGATTSWTRQAAKILAEEAVQAVYDLENRGLAVQQDRRRARSHQRRFGGHTRNFGEAAGAAELLRGGPHRPHDPPDPLPAVHQERSAASTTSSRRWT